MGKDVNVANSLTEAISIAQTMTQYDGPIWICGGEEVYAESVASSDKLFITRIHEDFEGDRKFAGDWEKYFKKLTYSRDSSHNDVKFTFEVWEK